MCVFQKKRAHLPSFFMFIAIVLILVLSILIHDYVYWFFSISIIFLLALYFLGKKIFLNPLTLLAGIFIFLLIFNMIFIRPVNNAEAAYLIWLFAGSFLLFSYGDEKFIKNTFSYLIVIFIFLSIWGLIQYITGYGVLVSMGGRANAIFVTPNTFSASINSLLLPLIVLFLLGKSNKYLFPSILILFAAFLATKSRGGWIAFMSGFIFIFLLIKVLCIKLDRKRLKSLLLGLTIVFVLYSVVDISGYGRLDKESSFDEAIGELARLNDGMSSMSNRIQLFDIAWRRIKEKPFLGYGFHTYQHYRLSDQKVPFIAVPARFVHNDYLQLFMELGVLGFVLPIAFFMISLFYLWKLSDNVAKEDKILMFAIMIGLTSLYVHALVDFIFYTPFLLMMIACSLGLFNETLNKYHKNISTITIPTSLVNFNVLKSLVGVCVVFLLFQAAISQLTYDNALKKIEHLDVQDALVYYELARRFAPYEPDYYWHEGAVLMNAVKARQHKPSAERAEELFSKGMDVSPYTTNNRLARAELHRDYGHLLTNPEDLNIVLSWNKQALHWRPKDPIVRAEYLKTLNVMGKFGEASRLLNDYLLESPESESLDEVKRVLQKTVK